MKRVAATAIAIVVAVLVGVSPAAAMPTLYVANSGSTTVTPFEAGATASDFLVPLTPIATDASVPLGTAGTPNGRYVYVALNGSDGVDGFAVAPDGTLTKLAGSPFATGLNPVVPAVSPDGAHLYVANFGADTISAYEVGSSGALSALPGPLATTGDGPQQISFTPDGRYVYVPNFGNGNVSGFSVGADGALTALPGSPFPAGSFPNNSEVTPDGKFLYVSNRNDNNVSAYAIGADGALTAVPGSPFPTGGTMPNGLAATADGADLYVAATGSNLIVRFTIAANGALTNAGTTPAGGAPGAVATDDRSLFVANGTSNDVASFFIEASGALGERQLDPTGGTSPTGRSIALIDTDDRVAFAVERKARQKQTGKRVRIKFSIKTGEPIDVAANGVVTARGIKKAQKLKALRVGLPSGLDRRFTLTLAKRSKNRAILGRIDKGKRAKATITFTATDDLGNSGVRRVKVKLK